MAGLVHVVVPIGLLILGLSACAPTESAPQGPDGTPVAAAEPARPPPPPQRSESSSHQHRSPRMLHATMSIPAIGIHDVDVVPYGGSPDDGPGTRIQNGGVAASPFGARGGVGPGQVGNYIVTAHRTTPPAPFADLPSLRRDAHVRITAGMRVFDYRVTRTRSTSFRSRRSLMRQAAAVPGRPGVPATRAMITLSTCATPEDHARGNYWADEFGNPEHRIDKVGVLVDTRPDRS